MSSWPLVHYPAPAVTLSKTTTIYALSCFATHTRVPGRSDFPNQINNVCAFPYIFRGACGLAPAAGCWQPGGDLTLHQARALVFTGALDARAKCINSDMKLAATYALAELAKEHPGRGVARVSADFLQRTNMWAVHGRR